MSIKRLIVFADGGSWGNPGPSAVGAVIKDEQGRKVAEISRYIGIASNNQAEYWAAIYALEAAAGLHPEEVELSLDSQLVVRQMEGKYRVSDAALSLLFHRVMPLARGFRRFSIVHIPSQQNGEAHALAQRALALRSRSSP